ncbi:MAG: DUF6282 family protein [Tissierellia bacterium]|nr:DUF6282 family protein [Tissierellia bacterium]
MKISLKGIYDMHVHTAPDIRERRYTDFELLEAAVRMGAKGIVIKSHHGTTMNRAFLCNEYNYKIHGKAHNDFTMYGSITLNKAVGGLNKTAVETAIKLGAKVVWLPTMHAKNQMKKLGKPGGIDCFHEDGTVRNELKEIFKLIKEYNVTLGTGHLSPEEIFKVVDTAKNMGLEKIVITHPEFWVVGMSHEDQVKIVKEYDVILERCYAQNMGGGKYQSNLQDNFEIIKKVGYKNVMVDTDGGQIENPAWENALSEYIEFLYEKGITQDELDYMTKIIPSKLLEGDK